MHFEDLLNVSVHEGMPLGCLPMNRMLAAFIPYVRKGDADAVELPNKVLQLLAYGLPIVKTGMPNAVKAEFVLSVEDDDALDAGIDACIRNFSGWQAGIRAFLAEHSAEARLTALRIGKAN
jgi:hypothetical protein